MALNLLRRLKFPSVIVEFEVNKALNEILGDVHVLGFLDEFCLLVVSLVGILNVHSCCFLVFKYCNYNIL